MAGDKTTISIQYQKLYLFNEKMGYDTALIGKIIIDQGLFGQNWTSIVK